MMHLRADGEMTVERGDCGFDRANGAAETWQRISDGPDLQLHMLDDYATLTVTNVHLSEIA